MIRKCWNLSRFKTNTRLCLSISDFHPDTWNPAWSVSTILTGLLSFMVSTHWTGMCSNSKAFQVSIECEAWSIPVPIWTWCWRDKYPPPLESQLLYRLNYLAFAIWGKNLKQKACPISVLQHSPVTPFKVWYSVAPTTTGMSWTSEPFNLWVCAFTASPDAWYQLAALYSKCVLSPWHVIRPGCGLWLSHYTKCGKSAFSCCHPMVEIGTKPAEVVTYRRPLFPRFLNFTDNQRKLS